MGYDGTAYYIHNAWKSLAEGSTKEQIYTRYANRDECIGVFQVDASVPQWASSLIVFRE
jgi:hypothetical protein